jgi:hypothetical protein
VKVEEKVEGAVEPVMKCEIDEVDSWQVKWKSWKGAEEAAGAGKGLRFKKARVGSSLK